LIIGPLYFLRLPLLRLHAGLTGRSFSSGKEQRGLPRKPNDHRLRR
jgi:hypothetical protein